MWKKRPQEKNSDGGDSSQQTNSSTRRVSSSSSSSTPLPLSYHLDTTATSRYEIGHGSSDYSGYLSSMNGIVDRGIPSPSSAAAAGAATTGSGLDSPGSEGLHHRKSHYHTVQQAAAAMMLTNNMSNVATTTTTTGASSSSSVNHDLLHPLLAQRSTYNNNNNNNNVGRNNIGRSNNNNINHHHHHHHHGLLRRLRGNRQAAATSTASVSSSSSAWKKLAKCAFVSSLFGYVLFLYLAQNHYRKKGVMPFGKYYVDQQQRLPGQYYYDKGEAAQQQHSQPSLNNWNDRIPAQQPADQLFTREDQSTAATTMKDAPLARPLGDMHDYIFQSALAAAGQNSPKQHSASTSSLTGQRFIEWSTNSLQHARTVVDQRRKNRRQRTIPPAKVQQQSNGSGGGGIPLWYELHHSSEETILSLQSRWNDASDDISSDTATAVSAIDPAMLCGVHAQRAAKHHPKNYQFPNMHRRPLGPQSRVLITGILSPLGLHLTIALHRQCGVVNFLGLDSMFPNDPFSRLEYQERLAVLMEELGKAVELHVPFLGLESKQSSDDDDDDGRIHERLARDATLVELRDNTMHGKNDTNYSFFVGNDGTADRSSSAARQYYALPFVKYGIHLTPGTARDGSGPLNAVLDYRPTHIVHLAGTQSDSLLNSNYHGEESDDDVSPRGNAVFRNKDEEEDDILIESISSRPHLYDLRMGTVGMEQLLSAAVAQMMLPPTTVGPSVDTTTTALSERDLERMTKPHIVYASSYDALTFRDTAVRLQQGEKKKEEVEYDNLGSTTLPQPKRPTRGLHGVSRLIDEVISSSYHSLYNIPSIGLRFDAIYGPRGFGVSSASVPIFHADTIKRRGVSADVELAESAVRNMYRKWMDAVNAKAEQDKAREEEEDGEGDGRSEQEVEDRRLEEARHVNLLEETGWIRSAHDRRDFVFVEDSVGAIIAAMQYRSLNNSPITFNIGSGEMSNLASLADEIQELAMLGGKHDRKMSISKNVIDVEQSSAARAASVSSNDYLRWAAKTSLKDGAAKLLAWHLDRAMPFFRAASSDADVDYSNSQTQKAAVGDFIPTPFDGETILSRRQISPCTSDDPTCFREPHTSYPCSSECSTQSCVPSVFDGVMKITHEVTEDCDVVLYTIALGYDVQNLELETEYSDGEDQMKWWETTVCTLAFVPSESTLIKKVIGQVPPEKLLERGLTPESSLAAKVNSLNGYLAHRGWVLILVDGTTKPMSAEDMFVPKLSPARLFHSSVRKAMFVDENFNHTPYPEDAQFLASETSRGVLPQRTITGPDAKGHKTKYKLPEEPQRRAVLLVSPMRNIPDAESDQMPLNEITISMMKDTGLNPDEIGEPDEIRIQREYYERARSLINSMDHRSLDPIARNKLEIKVFIRSKWVIHHLKLEEGHQLRCEWYREHIRWGTHLDQLSFAYVMAKRELTRKVIMRLPLTAETDEEDSILQQIIRMKSDAHEWHPIFSDEGAASALHHTEISPEAIPINLQDLPDNEVSAVTPDLTYTDVGSTFYVRIMSDDQMLESRRRWTKARDAHRKYVKKMKEIERREAEAAKH